MVHRRPNVLLLGDSHWGFFFRTGIFRYFGDFYFSIAIVSGATVTGLQNWRSRTRARKIYEYHLRCADPQKTIVVVLLGETDCSFLIWSKAQQRCLFLEVPLQEAVGRYVQFLERVAAQFPLIVISTPLPTVADDDYCLRHCYRIRKEVASQREKTKLTLEFNRRVHKACRLRRICYLDLDEACLGPDGLVSPKMRSARNCDHHYHKRAYAEVLQKPLREALLRLQDVK